MNKQNKAPGKISKKLVIALIAVVVVIAAVATWAVLTYGNPSSGKYTFTVTEFVGNLDGSPCTYVTYNTKQYCIDDWSKVYNAMDAANQKVESTLGTDVTTVFTADFHIGTAPFLRNEQTPTIFLDKVYSAKATKQ